MSDRILNVKHFADGLPPDAVYVGRGGWGPGRRWYPASKWANRAPIAPDLVSFGVRHDREGVIRLFETYARDRLAREPHWLDPLRGKRLACHCAPEACHAEVLLRLLGEGEHV